MYEVGIYLGRSYTIANRLGGAVVLKDNLYSTKGGHFTVPARMVREVSQATCAHNERAFNSTDVWCETCGADIEEGES